MKPILPILGAWPLLFAMALAGCDIGNRAAPFPVADAPAASQRATALALAAMEPPTSGDACVVETKQTRSDASGRKTRLAMATVRCAEPARQPLRKRSLVASVAPRAGAAPADDLEPAPH